MFGKKTAGDKVARRAAKASSRAAKKSGRNAGKAEKRADVAQQAADRAEKNAARAEKKALAAQQKAEKAKKQPVNIIETLTSPKTATRALAVAKLVGPVVAPVALRATTAARGYLDERRALKLGVTAGEVAAYRGPTGPAGARVAGLRSAVDEVRRRRSADLQVVRFADVAGVRLTDLHTAVTTAGSMPPARRRATLGAINKELDQIEADLMTYLVGTSR